RALEKLGRLDEARKRFGQAVAGYERLIEEFPDVPDYQARLAGCLSRFAFVLVEWGERAEALRVQERAVGHRRTALRLNARNFDYRRELAHDYYLLGIILLGLGRHREAEEALGPGLAVAGGLAKDFPAAPDARL